MWVVLQSGNQVQTQHLLHQQLLLPKEFYPYLEVPLKEHLLGLHSVYQKDLGQNKAVVNIAFLETPDFIDLADKEDWLEIIEEEKDSIQMILDEVVKQELTWSDYLFSQGREVIGLNAELLKSYTLHMAEPVYNALGSEFTWDSYKKNPLPYMDSYIDSTKVQSAAQEIQLTSYKVGAIEDDTAGLDLDF